MAKKRPTLDAFLSSEAPATQDEPVTPAAAPKQAKKPVKKPVAARPSGATVSTQQQVSSPVTDQTSVAIPRKEKYEIVRHMLYLPVPVYDQLQGLIFEEQRGQSKRRKMHDYLLDAIDLLFKEKGIKSIGELTGENK